MLPHRAPRCLARVMAVASAVLRQCMRSARVSDACALHSRFRCMRSTRVSGTHMATAHAGFAARQTVRKWRMSSVFTRSLSGEAN